MRNKRLHWLLMRTPPTGSRQFHLAATFCLSVAGHLPIALAADSAPSDSYSWRLPPGFPLPWVPADNPMSASKVALGCRLFFDTQLSTNGRMSCATCHSPELAYTDGRNHAHGATGEPLRRSSMSLTNVAYNFSYTWASRSVTTLEAQMETPLFGIHPVEMGLDREGRELLPKLGTRADYVTAFKTAFPNDSMPVSIANLIKAIAAFERTLISGRSAFDRYVYDDDGSALSATAKRGMELFFSARTGCSQCHGGVNFSGPIRHADLTAAEPLFANTGMYDMDGKGAYPEQDRGLIEHTGKSKDMGRFRVPTLRNIALTAPYMHNGSMETLEEAVDHYSAGGQARSTALTDKAIRPLSLTAAEKQDLIDFLSSLTDAQFAKSEPCGALRP